MQHVKLFYKYVWFVVILSDWSLGQSDWSNNSSTGHMTYVGVIICVD